MGVSAIVELKRAGVGFCDLAGQGESDTGAGFFCSVEGHEEIPGVGESGAVVGDGNVHETRARPRVNRD